MTYHSYVCMYVCLCVCVCVCVCVCLCVCTFVCVCGYCEHMAVIAAKDLSAGVELE